MLHAKRICKMTSRRRWVLDALQMAGGLLSGLAVIALITSLLTPPVGASAPPPEPTVHSFSG